MIDWIEAKCRVWGFAKRRINGTPNLEKLKDGTIPSGNAKSFAGRIKDEGQGAAIHSDMAVQPLEVMLGDALQVSVAIQLAITSGTLTDKQYEAVFAKYVIRGPTKVKLKGLGIGHKCFYDRIGRAHIALKPWLERGDNDTGDISIAA